MHQISAFIESWNEAIGIGSEEDFAELRVSFAVGGDFTAEITQGGDVLVLEEFGVEGVTLTAQGETAGDALEALEVLIAECE